MSSCVDVCVMLSIVCNAVSVPIKNSAYKESCKNPVIFLLFPINVLSESQVLRESSYKSKYVII